MTIWFTSDLHLYHTNVIKYCSRPYESVELMNSQLIHNWNLVVAPEDTVYCLGDFSLAARPVEIFTKQLKGRKILVLGNHDFPHRSNKQGKSDNKHVKWIEKYLEWGWDEVHMELGYRLGSTWCRLYHLPYWESPNPDSASTTTHTQEPRHSKFRLVDDSKLLLCGHVHNAWKHRHTPRGTLQVNVGVDQWDQFPVSEQQLISYIQGVTNGNG